MKNLVDLIVFDMAGTTVDEKNVVYKTIQKTLNDGGFDYDLETVLEFCAGKEKRTAINDVITHQTGEAPDADVVDGLFAKFKENLKSAYDTLDVGTFAGTKEFFGHLKSHNVNVALNTGYDRKTATGLLKKLAWEEGKDFDTLVTADDVVNGRPHPEMIHLAMSKTGVEDAQRVLKVGDSVIDIEEGQSANCKFCVGVTTGAQTRELLMTANPTHVVDRLDEMKEFIFA